jgi:thioredoxin reductase (NADPH)
MTEVQNVVIIWWWPAWHTAAIYTARAWLNPTVYEWFMAWWVPPGWQLTMTTEIENFPWFPDWIWWLEFMTRVKQQSEKQGTKIITKNIDRVDFSSHPFHLYSWDEEILAKTVIICTWATAKRLRIPWENQFWQRWVSVCAVCDGWLPIYRNQRIVVVWWWDVACEEALYLTNFASEVIMLVRRDVFRASKPMQEKVFKNEKIKVMWHTEAVSCHWEKSLESIKVINNQTNEESEIECSGLFYAVGHQPNTEFLKWQIEMDEIWYIITHDWVKTSVPGVFAAWDVQDKVYRQAITSAGTGCMAALEAERYLNDLE